MFSVKTNTPEMDAILMESLIKSKMLEKKMDLKSEMLEALEAALAYFNGENDNMDGCVQSMIENAIMKAKGE